jgi:hypothetical protein
VLLLQSGGCAGNWRAWFGCWSGDLLAPALNQKKQSDGEKNPGDDPD